MPGPLKLTRGARVELLHDITAKLIESVKVFKPTQDPE